MKLQKRVQEVNFTGTNYVFINLMCVFAYHAAKAVQIKSDQACCAAELTGK